MSTVHFPEGDIGAAILNERAGSHGNFAESAGFVQAVKQKMRHTPNWNQLTWSQRESLDMVIHKFGRLLHGDPHFFDHWIDAQNYLKLVTDNMEQPPCKNT